MSKTPIKEINSVSSQSVGTKPRGLWYGIGNSWIEWAKIEMPSMKGDYIYKVTLGGNVLKITTNDEFGKFGKRFQTFKDYTSAIDWKKVAAEYDGIEISPYRDEKRMVGWYYPWDVACGCVWNKNAIKDFTLIEK